LEYSALIASLRYSVFFIVKLIVVLKSYDVNVKTFKCDFLITIDKISMLCYNIHET